MKFCWKTTLVLLVSLMTPVCGLNADEAQLLRESYVSELDKKSRGFFVYLPTGYQRESDKRWPVLLFLHGNGERGNGQDELDFVLHHGPVYEAWIQKKPLPFIIISPQLHMFDFGEVPYIRDRRKEDIPVRLNVGVPPRPAAFSIPDPIERRASVSDMSTVDPLLPKGWEQVEQDLLKILSSVQQKYNADETRTYLTGLSYGGFGTWYMTSKHPGLFAAIVPVVGWGHPDLMAPIAHHKVPVWAFAGGRDRAVPIRYFYKGLETLEQLGHPGVRFTVHEDMGHDAWTRVYASSDLYDWLLTHKRSSVSKD